jgi:hypothetical protein
MGCSFYFVDGNVVKLAVKAIELLNKIDLLCNISIENNKFKLEFDDIPDFWLALSEMNELEPNFTILESILTILELDGSKYQLDINDDDVVRQISKYKLLKAMLNKCKCEE